ncbi:helix-turn-helix domain-containing protein [Paenibacillus senegalensis]|uniref:helix-turn-helix domain-containing protein n=1 Tax=Paenibacillus senegalensis TaxID=1465766 RepID=UPI000288E616|nr:AraC family transcriptional regulator [Paenibacillus senegalensis]
MNLKCAWLVHPKVKASVKTYLHNPFRYEQFVLHQAGEQELSGGRCTIASGDGFELGTLMLTTDEVRIDCSRRLNVNELLFLPPHTEVNLDVSGKAKFGFVRFSLIDWEGAHPLSVLQQIAGWQVAPNNTKEAGSGETLTRLLSETMKHNKYTYLLAGSYLNQLLVTIARYALPSQSEADPAIDDSANYRINTRREIAEQALSYIDNQFMELRDLREIAKTIGYSYSYVSHVFRDEMGISLQSYYTNKKLKKAMQMLASNRQSVTRVAELLRYQSIHSFSKAFKKFSGLTPTEFQQQYERKISI